MLDERKSAILRAVVQRYIETAQPVGSGHVVESGGVQVSSATVRNDMALLEREGYLAQPHTSAGRIPTEKGYRFFVDALEGPRALDQAATGQVRDFFAHAHGEIEQMLHDTSRLLSSVTGSAALVVSEPPEAKTTIRSVQLVSLAERLALAVVVLSNGAIVKHSVETQAAIDDGELATVASHLARHLTGSAVVGRADVPPLTDTAAQALVGPALAAIDAALEAEGRRVYVDGTARIAGAFDAVDRLQQVLSILEEQLVVVTIIRDVLDRGLNVAIGTETGVAPLSECALVVAPYSVDGEHAGTIGVLGPTRMNYPEAIAAVAAVSQRLGRTLSEG